MDGSQCGQTDCSCTGLCTLIEIQGLVRAEKRGNPGRFPRFHSYPQSSGGILHTVVHTRPQCGEREDDCGQNPQLYTDSKCRFPAAELSRGYRPLFHRLCTTLWRSPQPVLRGPGAQVIYCRFRTCLARPLGHSGEYPVVAISDGLAPSAATAWSSCKLQRRPLCLDFPSAHQAGSQSVFPSRLEVLSLDVGGRSKLDGCHA